MIDRQDLLNRFTFHPVDSEDTARTYELIRHNARELALGLTEICPSSRELSLAVTHLEQVVFWANAAVARHNSDGSRRLMHDPNQPPLLEDD